LPSRHPLSRLSFSWQIILLGTLVVVLSLAVLFAILATLRYTKSAVLKEEKDGLTQVARNLAQEFEDRAELACTNHQPPLLGFSDSPASRDVLGLLSRVVLQNSDATVGGFYSSSTDSLLGQYFPGGQSALDNSALEEGTGAAEDAVLSVARQAASAHEPADKVILNAPGIVLIEAVPLRDGYNVVGSAWSLKKSLTPQIAFKLIAVCFTKSWRSIKSRSNQENSVAKTVPMKRLTIIGDDDVAYRIMTEIEQLGATGYTNYVVHGKGRSGVRPRHGESSNAKIEIIATPEVAHRILDHVATNYFEHYAMIAFLDDVEVVRGPRFGAPS